MGPPSLAQATIVLAGFDSLEVDLMEGRGEARSGEALIIQAGLTDWVLSGDPDGDGDPGAIGVVWASGGGSGTFYELALFELREDSGGTPSWLWRGSTSLGDRIRLRALTLDRDVVEVHLTDHGPDDAMCCPTRESMRRFRVTAAGFEREDVGDEPG